MLVILSDILLFTKAMHYIYTLAIFLLISICANATTLDEAKALYLKGNYAKALPAFKEQIKKTPKDAALNQWLGVCLYETGAIDESIAPLTYADSKSVIEASRYLAYIAFKQYRFSDAKSHLEKYKASLIKANKTIPTEIETLLSKIINAANMLERVEKIQIIDSINVDKDKFFKFYKLSKESGSISDISILNSEFSAAKPTIVYCPESKNQMIWAKNIAGKSTLVSASKLSDGSWEKPHTLSSNLNEGGNANYPYLMPDGITLYFANDGENSIGGYDIFITRKNDNSYFQPQNIGMPYNSLYNDYMFVIDEVTGIGWWASDRNQIDGKVTIYTFITNESRINYPANSPNLINLAKINAIKDSWNKDSNYNNILKQLEIIDSNKISNSASSFSITLPNGNVYTTFSQFKNNEAITAMQEYLEALNQYNLTKTKIDNLRKLYSNGDKSIAQTILEMENSILTQYNELIRLRNIVVSLESK